MDRDAFQLRLLMPIRVSRARTAIIESDPFRFCRNADDAPAELPIARVHDSLADLQRRRAAERTLCGAPPALAYQRAYLFWLDVDYTPRHRKPQMMGGVAGRASIARRLSLAWWRLLVLGKLLGIGQRVAFGQWRYQLLPPHGQLSRLRMLPATSLLSRAAEPEVPRAARR
ncbi:MAG: hypothetical protein GVY09_14715 [Gammaproteobacteria bacterium]|jgi:hypothetical protein|nr:hypothetical protein [Gammaproteobacteria bacterium]